MARKLKPGSPLQLIKTAGRTPNSYDLYNLEGLSLGKVAFLQRILEEAKAQHGCLPGDLADELRAALDTVIVNHERQPLDEVQTINNG